MYICGCGNQEAFLGPACAASDRSMLSRLTLLASLPSQFYSVVRKTKSLLRVIDTTPAPFTTSQNRDRHMVLQARARLQTEFHCFHSSNSRKSRITRDIASSGSHLPPGTAGPWQFGKSSSGHRPTNSLLICVHSGVLGRSSEVSVYVCDMRKSGSILGSVAALDRMKQNRG